MKIIKNYYLSILMSMITVATVILPFIGIDAVSDFIASNSRGVSIVIMVVLFLVSLAYESHKRTKDDVPQQEIRKWRHSVLIFDDQKKDLLNIKDTLLGYDFDLVTVRDISDYRLAENFEIIFGDIMGVGASKDSISVLNMIKKSYPYKKVFAMSSLQGDKMEMLDVSIPFISKENRAEYPKVILNHIIECSKDLDDVDGHWTKVEGALMNEGIKSDLIAEHKRYYYSYVNSKVSGN